MDRAVAPAVGVGLLVGLTALAAAGVAVGALALDAPATPERVALSATAEAATDRVAVTHEGGSAVDVARVEVSIAVDGEELAHQPPVPFFSARGFRAGPTGPFNRGADPSWRAGERAGLRLASTNDPDVEAGATVTVTVADDDAVLGRARATAT